jgi:hypothetical protein
VASDDQLSELVHTLIGPGIRTQVWLLYLDDECRPLPLVMPFEGGLDRSADAEIEALSDLSHEVARHIGAAQVVIVWEREGQPRMTIGERSVIDRLAGCFPRGQTRLRAQFLCHSGGVVKV